MENINNNENSNSIDLEKDPVIAKAIQYTKEDNKNSEELVNEILDLITKKIKEGTITIKDGMVGLGQSIMFLTQTMCSSQDEFNQDVSTANNLVVNNIFPALGANANDEQLNKEGIVTYNGEFDQENFGVKRLMQVAAALINYTYWKVNYAKSLSEAVEQQEQQETKEN